MAHVLLRTGARVSYMGRLSSGRRVVGLSYNLLTCSPDHQDRAARALPGASRDRPPAKPRWRKTRQVLKFVSKIDPRPRAPATTRKPSSPEICQQNGQTAKSSATPRNVEWGNAMPNDKTIACGPGQAATGAHERVDARGQHATHGWMGHNRFATTPARTGEGMADCYRLTPHRHHHHIRQAEPWATHRGASQLTGMYYTTPAGEEPQRVCARHTPADCRRRLIWSMGPLLPHDTHPGSTSRMNSRRHVRRVVPEVPRPQRTRRLRRARPLSLPSTSGR